MYQFTPPAEVRFQLPAAARHIDYQQALRPGAYTGDGHSDGVGITWSVRQGDGTETILWREHFNPRDRPEHRGVVERAFDVPVGPDRVLILRTDPGPANSSPWDWPVFGQLRWR